jgi:hypothetical protein
MSMELRQASEVEVAKALMPEHRESRATKTANEEVARYRRELGVAVQRMEQRNRCNRSGVG